MGKGGPLAIAVFSFALAAGTVATLSSKVMYDITSIDMNGKPARFEKPIMSTFIMFVAMMIALPIHYSYLWFKGLESPKISTKMYFILILPALTDLLGTMFSMIGLLYVTVSVYQLVRCMVIVFVAILKVFVLGSKFHPYMWCGVAMNAIAITCVSASAFVDPNAGSNVGLGISCILVACLVMASQLVLEEKVMAGDNTPPLVVVGMEGFWGSLITLFIIFPIAYVMPGHDHGSYENLYDSLIMIKNSDSLLSMTLIYLCSITCYNVSAIFVTFLLESVWRSILENFRPIAVWGADLALFYVFTKGTFGEAWTVYSWLELAGLILLLAGTATYNGNLRWPCMYYPSEEDEDLKRDYTPTGDYIMNSPLVQKKPGQQNRDSLLGESTPLLGK